MRFRLAMASVLFAMSFLFAMTGVLRLVIAMRLAAIAIAGCRAVAICISAATEGRLGAIAVGFAFVAAAVAFEQAFLSAGPLATFTARSATAAPSATTSTASATGALTALSHRTRDAATFTTCSSSGVRRGGIHVDSFRAGYRARAGIPAGGQGNRSGSGLILFRLLSLTFAIAIAFVAAARAIAVAFPATALRAAFCAALPSMLTTMLAIPGALLAAPAFLTSLGLATFATAAAIAVAISAMTFATALRVASLVAIPILAARLAITPRSIAAMTM